MGLSETMNDLAAEGWEFQRAESLPCETRAGFFGGTKTFETNVLVFRRTLEEDAVSEPIVRPVRPPKPEAIRDLRAARGLGPAIRPEPQKPV